MAGPVADAVGFDFTSNQGSQSGTQESSTAFQRQGTTTTGQGWQLPAWLSSLLQQAPVQTQMPASVQSMDWSAIMGLLGQDQTAVPGKSILDFLMSIDPTTFTGSPQLDSIMARNPYSTDYETQMNGLFDRQFNTARADALSGPQNVRGGQARQGFELADVGTQQGLNRYGKVLEQQNKEAGIVEQATHIANMIESMRRGSTLQAQQQEQMGEHARAGETTEASGLLARSRANNASFLQLASEMLGTKVNQVQEDLSGEGQQIESSTGQTSGSGINAGMTCCFIFLEMLNGTLPDYVRAARDHYYTPNRRRGYVWMSTWLVPWMKKSKAVRHLVNWTMCQPLMAYGRFMFTTDGIVYTAIVTRPVVEFWFFLWSACGWLQRNNDKIKV